MNRPLFDPEHLRIAAEVRAKARRQCWLNLTRRRPLLLTIVLGGVVLPLFALAQIVLLLVRMSRDVPTRRRPGRMDGTLLNQALAGRAL
jgi:hypothetical protein